MRGLAVLCCAAALLAGCSTDDPVADTDTTAAPTTAITTTMVERAVGCPDPVDGEPADSGPFAVGRSTDEFVDASRPTEPPEGAAIQPSADRRLPVVVLYPAAGAAGEPGTFTEDVAVAAGSFPLVIYSHGVSSNATERNDALARWASAGYVVVAPTFPLSSIPGLGIGDLPNQPADVVFVADSFTEAVADESHPLHGSVRTDCLALAGHSLGGATTFAAALDPCCEMLDPRAVIDIAGLIVPVTQDADLASAEQLPTLIVHGETDLVVSYEQAERAMAELSGPRWLLSFPAGGHNSMFLAPELDVMTEAVVSFLDAQLKGAPGALDALPTAVDSSELATLQVEPAD